MWAFFTAGGSRCFVLRARPAEADPSASATFAPLTFSASSPGAWAQILRCRSPTTPAARFLMALRQQGGLFGTTPSQAFYVKCGASNNPPEVREQGLLYVKVGLAMIYPAEFIVLQLVQPVSSAS